MANANPSIRFTGASNIPLRPASVTFPIAPPKAPSGQPLPSGKFSSTTSTGHRPEDVSFSSPRCAEKGCVFPAASPQSAQCAYHQRQMEEPRLFCSQQPSRLLLDPARLLPAGEEYDESGKRDRRRLARLWEEFQASNGA